MFLVVWLLSNVTYGVFEWFYMAFFWKISLIQHIGGRGGGVYRGEEQTEVNSTFRHILNARASCFHLYNFASQFNLAYALMRLQPLLPGATLGCEHSATIGSKDSVLKVSAFHCASWATANHLAGSLIPPEWCRSACYVIGCEGVVMGLPTLGSRGH